LSGTRITTNIKADGEEITEGFGLINEWRIVRQTKSGQMSEIKVTLSDWLLRMVEGRSVLTLHRDYFRLRKPLERRIYELARKHCGAQEKWS
ncbi:replication initiator protein A, partial [Streptomyces brasiliscabiei]